MVGFTFRFQELLVVRMMIVGWLGFFVVLFFFTEFRASDIKGVVLGKLCSIILNIDMLYPCFFPGFADLGHRDVPAQLCLTVCGWYRLCRDPSKPVARTHSSAGGQCHKPQQHRAHERINIGSYWLHLPRHSKC